MENLKNKTINNAYIEFVFFKIIKYNMYDKIGVINQYYNMRW